MDFLNLVLSFLEGLLTFISPCILPLIPVYVVYLAGEGALDSEETKKRLILNSFGFVIGFTLVFLLLGITATSLGMYLKEHVIIIRKISGVLMIVFGLNFMGIFKINFLNFEKRLEYNENKLNFGKAILFGIIFSLGWSPCVGQFLSVALLMAANMNTILEGILLLLAYSLGLGIPFILVGALFDNLKGSLKAMNKHRRIINIISGIIMIVAGVLTFSGSLLWLTNITFW